MSNWMKLIPKPRSMFLLVKCPDCENEQVLFDSATIVVKCNMCDSVLAQPRGGKAKLLGKVVNTFE